MKSESLNDIFLSARVLPKIRQAGIRDLIKDMRGSTPEFIKEQVILFCEEKQVDYDMIGIDQDNGMNCITLQTGGTLYYFRIY